jgi:hypothetical protein
MTSQNFSNINGTIHQLNNISASHPRNVGESDFSLPFQMLAIVSLIAIFLTFSAILNVYLNHSAKKKPRANMNELSKLLDDGISHSFMKTS